MTFLSRRKVLLKRCNWVVTINGVSTLHWDQFKFRARLTSWSQSELTIVRQMQCLFRISMGNSHQGIQWQPLVSSAITEFFHDTAFSDVQIDQRILFQCSTNTKTARLQELMLDSILLVSPYRMTLRVSSWKRVLLHRYYSWQCRRLSDSSSKPQQHDPFARKYQRLCVFARSVVVPSVTRRVHVSSESNNRVAAETKVLTDPL